MKSRSGTRLKVSAYVAGAVLPALVSLGAPAVADEVFKATTAITLPTKIQSFDISFVDPVIGLYVLGDRTGNAADVIDTTTNTLVAQFGKGLFTGPGLCPPAKQPAGANDCAGPDGVLIVNHSHIWVGDGDSSVKIFEIAAGPAATPVTVSTGGVHRADELCVDPEHQVVLVANNAESPFPFATAISVKNPHVLKRITFDGTGTNPKATNGAEQCQWSPRTEKFYISIPEIDGPGDNSVHGGVAVIDPVSLTVEKTFLVDVTKCSGPQGMAIGPDHQILLGCNGHVNADNATVIIDERDGRIIKTLKQESGADEVWFNPGDGHYFLARSSAVSPFMLLGVVDAERKSEDASAITNSCSAPNPPCTGVGNVHSVAADSVSNQVYVPIPASANQKVCSSAGGTDATGCIAVFTTPNDDKCVAEGSPVIRVSEDGDEDHMREGCRRHHHDD
jgi:hypothetical protein